MRCRCLSRASEWQATCTVQVAGRAHAVSGKAGRRLPLAGDKTAATRRSYRCVGPARRGGMRRFFSDSKHAALNRLCVLGRPFVRRGKGIALRQRPRRCSRRAFVIEVLPSSLSAGFFLSTTAEGKRGL